MRADREHRKELAFLPSREGETVDSIYQELRVWEDLVKEVYNRGDAVVLTGEKGMLNVIQDAMDGF